MGVLQCVLIRAGLTLVSAALHMAGCYQEGDYSLDSAYLWMTLVNCVSQTYALYALFLFYHVSHNDFRGIRSALSVWSLCASSLLCAVLCVSDPSRSSCPSSWSFSSRGGRHSSSVVPQLVLLMLRGSSTACHLTGVLMSFGHISGIDSSSAADAHTAQVLARPCLASDDEYVLIGGYVSMYMSSDGVMTCPVAVACPGGGGRAAGPAHLSGDVLRGHRLHILISCDRVPPWSQSYRRGGGAGVDEESLRGHGLWGVGGV